jgi:hypothetical protein
VGILKSSALEILAKKKAAITGGLFELEVFKGTRQL